MYNKILITGGSGMVGKSLQRLVKESDNENRYIFISSKTADLTDLKSTQKLFNDIRPDAVIHLAAVVGGLFFNIQNNASQMDLNLRININVMRCCVETGVKKVILVNSSCAFPQNPPKYPMEEQDLHAGSCHYSNEGYGTAKRAMEILGRLYSETTSTKFISVFPVNIYGPEDNFNPSNSHVLSGLLLKAYNAKNNNKNFTVMGSGNPLRQFIYVDDVAKLLLEILNSNTDFSSMILCNDDPEISINDLAEKICDIIEFNGSIVNDTTKEDGLYRKTVSNNMLRKFFPLFKFTPIDQGIKNTYEWLKYH